MEKKEIIELTNKLYKLTLLFPKKEPLRYKMREKADEILVNFIKLNLPKLNLPNLNEFNLCLTSEVKQDLEILNSYFEVAKWQNWVSYFDVLAIQEEYGKMERDFKKEIEDLEEAKNLKLDIFSLNRTDREHSSAYDSKSQAQSSLDSRKDSKFLAGRQGKILKFLKEKGKVQVWEVNKIFPGVSKRTIRRDFAQLLEKGLVERIGQRNNTFYRLKVQEI